MLMPRLPVTVQPRAGAQGFTLVEMLVALTIFGLLLATSAPAFSTWVKNARIRTAAQQLQDGIRLAHAEASRRSRQTVFSLTNDVPGLNSAAVANGSNWAVHTVPLLGSETREFIQGARIADQTAGVTITGPAALCFNSAGRRQVTNATPGVSGADCTTNAATAQLAYNVTSSGTGTRQLRVTVALGGQVRICDADRTLSATAPDGC